MVSQCLHTLDLYPFVECTLYHTDIINHSHQYDSYTNLRILPDKLPSQGTRAILCPRAQPLLQVPLLFTSWVRSGDPHRHPVPRDRTRLRAACSTTSQAQQVVPLYPNTQVEDIPTGSQGLSPVSGSAWPTEGCSAPGPRPVEQSLSKETTAWGTDVGLGATHGKQLLSP